MVPWRIRWSIFQIVDDTYAYPYRPAGWIDLKIVVHGREYRVDLKDEDNDLLASLVLNTNADVTEALGYGMISYNH